MNVGKTPFIEFGGRKFHRVKSGYYRAQAGGVAEYLHIAVWRSVKGEIAPGFHVDHVDGDQGNVAIENLRLLSHEEFVQLRGNRERAVEAGRYGGGRATWNKACSSRINGRKCVSERTKKMREKKKALATLRVSA